MEIFQLISTLFIISLLAIGASASISITTYAPIPSAAAGPVVNNPPGYLLQSFGDGAYMVTDGIYNNIFFVACHSVIVVDAPPTIGKNLLKAIRGVTPLPISHVVYSHSHADHTGGAYLLGSPSNISFIAHKETADKLALAPDFEHRPYPTTTFETSYTLHVCNQTLQLDYLGPNHEPGNIFIYASKQKILMVVDIIYPGWSPFQNLGESQNIPGYVKAHDQILTYDFDYFVGGHLNRPGTRQDVLIQREYVQDLFDTCKAALIASGRGGMDDSNLLSNNLTLPPEVKANPGNPWAEFAYYFENLAEYVAIETNRRWKDRLAATDVFGLSHARTMLEPLRIDWGVLGPFGVAN